jgi:hypothetical protein
MALAQINLNLPAGTKSHHQMIPFLDVLIQPAKQFVAVLYGRIRRTGGGLAG